MISYPEVHFVQNLLAEMREKTKDLPPFRDSPAVDYTNARHAYALNTTLLHDPYRYPGEVLSYGPSEAAQILLVERASGHGVVGSFSGVSGYIDTLQDPHPSESRVPFDPIVHTLREELMTECGFTEETFSFIDFYAGYPTVEERTITPDAKISVVSILGLCACLPHVAINEVELASYRWVDLRSIRHAEHLARGYFSTTLPAALGAIGLRGEALARLLD
jgi:hypothetical protein